MPDQELLAGDTAGKESKSYNMRVPLPHLYPLSMLGFSSLTFPPLCILNVCWLCPMRAGSQDILSTVVPRLEQT